MTTESVRRAWRVGRRWRAERLPRRVPSAHPTGAPGHWLSTEPPILLSAYWLDERHRHLYSLGPVFERLRHTSVDFLYTWNWHIDEPSRVRTVARMERSHRRRCPGHRFVHLCNSPEQLDAFRAAGLDAVLCSHNCLVDERVFRPQPGVAKRFDAVYNARFKGYKRHPLAADVDSLALIYAMDPGIDDPAEVAEVGRLLAHATFANHGGRFDGDGHYRTLGAEEIVTVLNQSRVGLCLSAVDGAMVASIEYLLCGVPIVSTASRGGRDVFFDEGNALIVDDTPEAVCAGVETMAARQLAAEAIRERALGQVHEQRRTLQDVVQAIYDREGVGRRFADEWPGIITRDLLRFRTHDEILSALEDPRSLA